VNDDTSGAAANEKERRRWNDARWTRTWRQREGLTAQVTPAVISALHLEPGTRALEIGSGTGGLAVEIAGLVGESGSVVGVDLSESLLESARDRAAAAGVHNLTFLATDAQTAVIPPPLFDVAVSQFGVMFFEDPVAAFTHIRAHIRPGGRLVFACWQPIARNPWHSSPVLNRFVPPPPNAPSGAVPGPFSLGDAERTTAILESAGFVDSTRADAELTVTSAANALFDAGQLEYLGVPTAEVPVALAAIEEYLARFLVGEGLYRFPIAYSVCTAVNPPN
jgi:SAM-dependent methyltransferase